MSLDEFEESSGNSLANDWTELMGLFLAVVENQYPRLNEESGWFGLGNLDHVIFVLGQVNPQKAMRLFREENPDLDFNEADPYDVAVAVLHMLVE